MKKPFLFCFFLFVLSHIGVVADNCVPATDAAVVSFSFLPQGVIKKAVFSVSETKKVLFSQGNLQYQPSTQKWRFAEHQWDFVGNNSVGNVYVGNTKCSNLNSNASYSGWRDLFMYGASGYNNRYPYTIGYPSNAYLYQSIIGTNYDWGIYCAISNGGNQAGSWRTITSEELQYLLTERADAAVKFGFGRVNNVNGCILLPDDWVLPTGMAFTSSSLSSGNYSNNVYSAAQWDLMEANGAVFLPAAGLQWGTTDSNFGDIGLEGRYWTASYYSGYYAYCLYLRQGSVFITNSEADARDHINNSVRLICDYN